jgi:hypothetical protein
MNAVIEKGLNFVDEPFSGIGSISGTYNVP